MGAKKLVYIVGITIACCAALLAFNIFYIGYVDDQSNKKWCTLVVNLDSEYSSTPPTTELGVNIATAIKDLKNEFNC